MKVVTFGEIMLRLTPQNHNRIGRTPVYEATYGGAESNVACSLAQLGIPAEFVTKLPRNAVADGAVSVLKSFGVGTEHNINFASVKGILSAINRFESGMA